MTVEYKIIRDLHLVYVKMHKALSIEELIAHLDDLAADQNYIQPMRKIVDFTNIKDAVMPIYRFGDFGDIEGFYKTKLRGEHCVFVADSDFFFGMARLFEGYMDGKNIKVSVVRSLDMALALLNIHGDAFRNGQ